MKLDQKRRDAIRMRMDKFCADHPGCRSMNVTEVAKVLGCSEQHVLNLILNGDLEAKDHRRKPAQGTKTVSLVKAIATIRRNARYLMVDVTMQGMAFADFLDDLRIHARRVRMVGKRIISQH